MERGGERNTTAQVKALDKLSAHGATESLYTPSSSVLPFLSEK